MAHEDERSMTEEVEPLAARLLKQFKETLSNLPQFQQALARDFFSNKWNFVAGRPSNEVSFAKDGFVYAVEFEEYQLRVSRVPELLAQEGRRAFEWSGKGERVFYGEEVEIQVPGRIGGGRARIEFQPVVDTAVAKGRIERILVDLSKK